MVCSPTPTHVPYITTCIEKNIPVFCEKPVDLNIEKIIELEKAVSRTNHFVQIGFNRRFDPDFRRLKKSVDEGSLGKIHQITIVSRDPGLPTMEYIASSGGMLLDMSIHDFDMCRYLSGSSVIELFCTGSVRVDERLIAYNDFDTATTVLVLENGISCTVINSREALYGYDQRIEVFGTKGMITVDNLLEHRLSIHTRDGQSQGRPESFFLERYAASYQEELEDVLERILNNRSPSVTLTDARLATEIAIKAQDSIQNKKNITF